MAEDTWPLLERLAGQMVYLHYHTLVTTATKAALRVHWQISHIGCQYEIQPPGHSTYTHLYACLKHTSCPAG